MNEQNEKGSKFVEIPEYIQKIFTYHAPKNDQPSKYEALRNNAKTLAWLIHCNCPESREKSLAITKLQECIMFANASIAINE